jgi:hypothetical protein
MSCESKTYPFSAETAAEVASKIFDKSGIHIDTTQTSGSFVVHSVHLSYEIADGNIAISVESKPFFVSCDQIYSGLDDLFKEA